MPEEHKVKFIPMLSQIEECAKQLPDPATFAEQFREVKIENTDKTVRFERIKVRKHDGVSAYKWTFKGRIFINSKFFARE